MVLGVGFEPTIPKEAALQAVERFVPDLLSPSIRFGGPYGDCTRLFLLARQVRPYCLPRPGILVEPTGSAPVSRRCERRALLIELWPRSDGNRRIRYVSD